jgi:hypothetical protein
MRYQGILISAQKLATGERLARLASVLFFNTLFGILYAGVHNKRERVYYGNKLKNPFAG